MLTVLLVSDANGKTKLAGFKLVTSKDGAYTADQVINILTDNLGKQKFLTSKTVATRGYTYREKKQIKFFFKIS